MNLSSNTVLTNSPNRDSINNGNSSSAAVLTGAGTPPTPGGKFSANDDNIKKNPRSSLQVLLPKLPSSDSLSNSPGPSSPGLPNWADSSPKVDGNSSEKLSDAANKLNRKESYKAQRKNYRREKKRVASELLNSLQDPAIIVLADWLKVRGTLKSWTKLWCVLKPGLLLLYKSPKTKSSHWVGTVLLTSCQIIERPSKKDGFCFKLFHPLDQSIWAPRGPDKETIGAVVQPLPTAYLIFRAPSQAAGKCWMDALELSLRCSALLLRSTSGSGGGSQIDSVQPVSPGGATMTHETQWSEADYEKHFNDHAKYIPPTPPPLPRDQSNLQHLIIPDDNCSIPRSPCPSPTPLFQQLYQAVSHWERVISDTPETIQNRYRNIKRMERIRDEGEDDTDDERSYENSPSHNSLVSFKEPDVSRDFLKSVFKKSNC